MKMKKLLIFDGNSIVNRAFYAIKALTNSKGFYTNGIHGFMNIFLKFIEEEKPDYVCVAFDVRAKTFRHKMYDKYKAQRKGMPQELADQMPYLKEVLKGMNVKMLEKEGYEADDIIGTVSKKCSDNKIECVIVSGDKDDLQLASKTTLVKLIVTQMGKTETTTFDDSAVFEKYGVTPDEFIHVKALMGDTSDNIPGVSGIGEKSAFSLISQYKSLDNLYRHLDELKGAQREKIESGRDMAYLSFDLARIDVDVPMDIDFDEMTKKEFDNDALYELFTELELKTLAERLGVSNKKSKQLDCQKIEMMSADVIEEKVSDTLYYFMEYDDILRRFSFYADGKVYYAEFVTEFEVMLYADVLKKVFENKNIKKVSHGIKDDIVFLNNNYGICFEGELFDTQIGAYILQPSRNSYEIQALSEEYLGLVLTDSGLFPAVLPQLCDKIDKEINANSQQELLYEIEFPLVNVLASMEIEGFTVDKESLAEFSKVLSERISDLEKGIYESAGEKFNINSPKQLGVILFEKLGLPVVKKTKTGYSTNVEVLEKLKSSHEIVDMIMEYRTYAKLKSTYADGLYSVINPKTGKINSSFNQTITTTGRISSTEPNLQNIPVRLELGRQIRKMFVASKDSVLVDADYSQIELRVLAHISGDKTMIEAFKNNEDIHTITASEVFKVPLDMVTSSMRSKAKAVNFGIVYGIGEFSLAQDIKVSRKTAKEYIDSYFETYPDIKIYLDKAVEFAKETGYVKTLLGRRRYIPEIKSSNFNFRSFGERVAMNAPIQGYAADIIKIAMVKVYQRLKKEGLKSKLILQVHDELIIDAKKHEVENVKKILKEEMENAVQLKIPLIVDMKSAESWYDTK
ncbi:MAG: DNA polymerase I [Clostridia bacterium]|nr:DNA polymerase I [Clostridia bacterium]